MPSWSLFSFQFCPHGLHKQDNSIALFMNFYHFSLQDSKHVSFSIKLPMTYKCKYGSWNFEKSESAYDFYVPSMRKMFSFYWVSPWLSFCFKVNTMYHLMCQIHQLRNIDSKLSFLDLWFVATILNIRQSNIFFFFFQL